MGKKRGKRFDGKKRKQAPESAVTGSPRNRDSFRTLEHVSFGEKRKEPDRLFRADNLHVMRRLPSDSIDLIYIDPPFFSGREYHVVSGGEKKEFSFSDTWEGGMAGYLAWLNVRFYEMKRLLKKTGGVIVHLDEHAVHYCKIELDRIFGPNSFVNEIIWHYTGGGRSKRYFSNKHDSLLWYVKAGKKGDFYFDVDAVRVPYKKTSGYAKGGIRSASGRKYMPNPKGTPVDDVWDIPIINPLSSERTGYPTQKPEALLERIIKACSPENGVVADFFCGSGTMPVTAQRLGRRWLACDNSHAAVKITAERLKQLPEEKRAGDFPAPDFTVESWDDCEAP